MKVAFDSNKRFILKVYCFGISEMVIRKAGEIIGLFPYFLFKKFTYFL